MSLNVAHFNMKDQRFPPVHIILSSKVLLECKSRTQLLTTCLFISKKKTEREQSTCRNKVEILAEDT